MTQGWLNDQLDQARKDHYDAAVIVLDTPGGDEESMRKIVQKELQLSRAGTPVIVYVSPGGARAASAGVWISAGGRRARDGAGDEHRLLDADLGHRGEPRQRPAAEGHQRRGRVAPRASRRRHGRNAAWADKAVSRPRTSPPPRR